MTRIVPDTNIILSAVFWKGNPFEVIRRGILGEYELVLSPEILDEVIDRLVNKFNFPEDELHELINVLLAYCDIITSMTKLEVVEDDPKDDNGIERAFYVDFIVKFKDGTIGLFDTKGGMTAKDAGTRAKGLQQYIKKNKDKKVWGGIVIESHGSWGLNDKEDYEYNPNNLSEWKVLEI